MPNLSLIKEHFVAAILRLEKQRKDIMKKFRAQQNQQAIQSLRNELNDESRTEN